MTELSLAQIFDLLGRYGPGGIFVMLWWFERSERKDSQKELKHVSRDTVAALSELKAVVGQMAEIFKTGRYR
jgi:hypothetical protein